MEIKPGQEAREVRQQEHFNERWQKQMEEVKKQLKHNRIEGVVCKIKMGYGFIRCMKKERMDYFFHKSELGNVKIEALEVGDSVTFEPKENGKGLKAVNVLFRK